jgi:hypothetical protein
MAASYDTVVVGGSKVTREAITFAFIARAFEQGKGALYGLTPLFGACVAKRAGSLYEATAIAECLKQSFDLDISPLVVDSMVPALVSAGFLREASRVTQDTGIYRCIAPELGGDEAKVAAGVDALFLRFREFAMAELAKHTLRATEADIDASLLEALVHPDVLGITLSPPEKRKEGQLTLRKDATSSAKSARDALTLLTADFIGRHLQNGTDLTEALINASWGSLISEVVLELQRPDAPTDFSDLSVLIDSPIILDALDVGDASSARYADDLLALMRKANVRPLAFRHSIEEMQYVLSATLHNVDMGYEVSGPMGARIRKDQTHLAHVRAVIATLEARVKGLGIDVIEPSEVDAQLDKHFPEEFVDELRVWIAGEHLHEHVERDLRDARSVGYVARMRGRAAGPSLSQANAVFVSKNAHLTRVSSAFITKKRLAAEYAVPIVVTDQQLAGVLWFSAGGDSGATGMRLTQLKLAANCARVVQPSPDLIASMRKYLLDPTKTTEFEALLKIDRSAVCLVRETLGALSLSTADDAERILAQMKSAAIEEERAQLQKQLEETIALKDNDHQQLIDTLQQKIQKLSVESTDLQASHIQERANLRSEIGSLQQSLGDQRRKADDLAAGRAAVVDSIASAAVHLERRTKRRISAELFVLYLLLAFWASNTTLSSGSSALVSLVLTGLGFWKAPDLLFNKLAGAAASAESRTHRKKNAQILATLGSSNG